MGSLGERFSAGVKAASPTLNMGIGMMYEDRMAAINRAHDEHIEGLRQRHDTAMQEDRQAFLTEEGALDRTQRTTEAEADRTQRTTEAAADRAHAESMAQIRSDLQAAQWKDEKYQGQVSMIYESQMERIEALDEARDEGLSDEEYTTRLAEINAQMTEQIQNAATNAEDYMDSLMITRATANYDDPRMVAAVKAVERFGEEGAVVAVEASGIDMEDVRIEMVRIKENQQRVAGEAEAEAGRVAADQERMAALTPGQRGALGQAEGSLGPEGEPVFEDQDMLAGVQRFPGEKGLPLDPGLVQPEFQQAPVEEAGFDVWRMVGTQQRENEFKDQLDSFSYQELATALKRSDVLSPEQLSWVQETINLLLDENDNGGQLATY